MSALYGSTGSVSGAGRDNVTATQYINYSHIKELDDSTKMEQPCKQAASVHSENIHPHIISRDDAMAQLRFLNVNTTNILELPEHGGGMHIRRP